MPAERSLLKISEENSQGDLPLSDIQFSYREIPEYEGHSCSFSAEITEGENTGQYSARFAREEWIGLKCDCPATIEKWRKTAAQAYTATKRIVKRFTNEGHPYQCELQEREELILRLEGMELRKEADKRELTERSQCPWIY
jgi:hypothetical protein